MKNWIQILIIAFVMFSVFQFINGGTELPPMFAERPTLGAALEASKSDGKPTVVFYTADWCGPCSRLKSRAMRDEKVIKAFANTHPALMDCTTGHPSDDPFSVESYPTLVAVRDGKETSRVSGNMSAEELIAWLDSVITSK